MKLHWHRWKTRSFGTSYYLQRQPWSGDDTTRLLGDEIASVSRTYEGRWRYDIRQTGAMPGTWGLVGSPVRARRLVATHLARKSTAAFDDDHLEIVGP
jgi:hypothetical protein